MRTILRSALLSLLGSMKKPRNGIHVLNGHFLSRSVYKDNNQFLGLLNEMRSFAEFLRIEDAVELIRSGDCINFDGVGIAFTFDDGFSDCYDALAPALDHFNTNACFFINAGFIDGSAHYRKRFGDEIVLTPNKDPMTWGNVRELHNARFVIGNHTLDHVRLSVVEPAEIDHQILRGKLRIKEELGFETDYFAWPYGQSSDINTYALNAAMRSHRYIFSGFGFRDYFSFNGKVLNRRHFEADWPVRHLRYFLSFSKRYTNHAGAQGICVNNRNV
jgi:peptidoglycan/xylan/chitin deacetylase (PgdA/CDA1 family)